MDKKFVYESLVSGAISVLLDRIASPEVVNYLRGKKDSDFEGLLKRLKTRVSSLTAVLDDAEQRQIRNDSNVKAWLDEVEEAVLDAHDLFDEIQTDLLRQKVQSEFAAGTSEVRQSKRLKLTNFFPWFSSCNNRDSAIMEEKMKKILDRWEEIVKQKDLLGLKENVVGVTPWQSQRPPSTSLVDEVYGRDTDKEVMIKLLLSDDDNEGRDKIGVIPIVGMGGIGKTTLAQAVFNHHHVRDHFELKAWVCVSQDYDFLRVTKDILKEVSSLDDIDITNLNSLQVKLRAALTGKKFLIVLDDVWNENYLDWDNLRTPFNDGARGSKIIVSSRSGKVADVMGTVGSHHQLEKLADDACWQLFSRHASGIRDFTGNSDLERIGREIVLKCKGLPLAVKILGGLLRSTSNVQEWEKVLNSDIWELTHRQILPALRLSYHYLPSPLKRCFAYCSMFPTDYKFEKDELILLWMAENLLQDPKGNKKMEDVGDEYFSELVSRSFLQVRNDDFRSFFVMHDLLVDLAKFVSKYCFLLENRGGSFEAVVMKKTRHLAYNISNMDNWGEILNYVYEATHLRTFLTLFAYRSSLSEDALDGLFLKLKHLRVLSFSQNNRIRKIPDSIGDLRYLRYLDFSKTSISCLPETITSLYNLQTLKLEGCFSLNELPKDFHHLASLRHLNVSNTRMRELPKDFHHLISLRDLNVSYTTIELPSSLSLLANLNMVSSGQYMTLDGLNEMPTKKSQLKNLEGLSTFFVVEDAGRNLGDLEKLPSLRGTLHIKNLQNLLEPKDALKAKLKEKKYLEKLLFAWKVDFEVTGASIHEKEVLDNLEPNPTLKELNIIGNRGKEFPNWVGNESFCKLVDIKLSNCKHCVTLPPLGQLSSLIKLSINGFNAMVNVGPEFYGNKSSMIKGFPSLEELEFDEMPNWKEWSAPDDDAEAFPKLTKLSFRRCNSLTGDFPCSFPSLTELKIYDCLLLACSLQKMPKLIELKVENCCDNIITSTAEALEESYSCVPALKSLCLIGFQSLQTFWSNGQLFESMKSLSTLEIYKCSDATLFPSNISPLSGLTSLKVCFCEKLKFLGEKMHDLVPSLKELHIRGCLELESLPASGFPSTLHYLHIENCDKLVASRRKWNLQTLLPSLTEFWIVGSECEDMVSFPEEGLLPSTLIGLYIYKIKCLTRLNGKGLQQLNSLKHLHILLCENLQILPEEEGLPSSLVRLYITLCPLVEKKCERETGEYWNIVSHIPNINIFSYPVGN